MNIEDKNKINNEEGTTVATTLKYHSKGIESSVGTFRFFATTTMRILFTLFRNLQEVLLLLHPSIGRPFTCDRP